jgi:uncharacterized secreted protein with C-terminal beta-propeller domain
MRRRLWISALAVLPLAACTATTSPEPPISTGPAPALRLVAFDSCPQLLTDLHAAALKSVGPGGLPGPGSMRDARAVAAAGIGGPNMAVDKSSTTAFSGTNVHEAGADEPDIVKTDGRRIVTVSGGLLSVIDPATHAQTGTLALGPTAGQSDLLLAGDRALVLVRGGNRMLRDKVDVVTTETTATEVILVDLAAATPTVISRYRGDGSLVDARQSGTVARLVLSSAPRIAFPMTATDENGLLRQNQKAIRAATVEAWLPNWEITTGGQTTKGRLDCSAVRRPPAYSGGALLRVLTFDLAAPALTDGDPVGVLADGDIVYGTPGSLYVANNPLWWFSGKGSAAPDTATEIYKFELPAAGKPVYVAGGSVPGTLLNQYAMSEWDGHLRVATTDGQVGASAVRVLRERDGKLAEVGSVGGLGRDERIYAVRFLGDRGYVVTFRQTDPLYSLDLADPTRPRVTGELKITGYSAHLQQVGENRLIGIGQETSGDRRGLQVSLFDVADPAAPRRLAQQVVPGAWSEAEFDPHAVLWWPATGLLVVPASGPTGGGVLAMRVTSAGLTAAGLAAAPEDTGAPVRRALVVGDELWTMSDRGLLSANLSTLDRTGWVPLR